MPEDSSAKPVVPRFLRYALIVIATVGIIAIATPFVLIFGPPLLPPVRHTYSGNSVDHLAKSIPSLEGLEILACEYTSTRSDSRSIVPSPYNHLYESYGWITLESGSAERFRARGAWHRVDRRRVPDSLRAVLPSGTELLSSDEVNASFSNLRSAHFCRVVMPATGNTLYFIIRDDDHAFSD